MVSFRKNGATRSLLYFICGDFRCDVLNNELDHLVLLADPNAGKLSSIKTYLLIALIFNIFAVIGFAIATVALLIIIVGIIFVVPLVLSIVVLTRINTMRSAAESGDISKLKETNSVGWAIIALLFAGVITGIMLLVANGTINDLSVTPTSQMSSATTSQDSLEKLAKLKSLLDSGAISKDEYEAEKKKILG